MTYIYILLGFTVGGLIWSLLAYSDRSEKISLKKILFFLFLAGLFARIAFSVATPTFFAPDEQSHFNYAKYLYENRSFPIQTSKIGAGSNDWEYYQPPLYYITIAPIYGFLSAYIDDITISLALFRLSSIFIWCLTLLFTLKFLARLNVTSVLKNTFVVSMICLMPTYTFLSSVINNDNMLIFVGSVILYHLADHRSYKNSAVLGLWLGIAILTKLSGAIYFFAVAAVFIAQYFRKAIKLKELVLYLGTTFSIGGLLYLPWGFRNLSVYGDFFALGVGNLPAKWSSTFQGIYTSVMYVYKTFWAASGIVNNVRFMPFFGVGIIVLGLLGLIMIAKKGSVVRNFDGDRGSFLIGLGVTILINVALVLRFGILYGQSQGRFLLPTLLPLALFIAIGIERLTFLPGYKKMHLHVVGILLTFLTSFMFFSFKIFYFR